MSLELKLTGNSDKSDTLTTVPQHPFIYLFDNLHETFLRWVLDGFLPIVFK